MVRWYQGTITAILVSLLFWSPGRTQDDQALRDFVAQMTTEELVGQTLMIGYRTNAPTGRPLLAGRNRSNEGLMRLIAKYKPGAVILFDHNFDLDESKNEEYAWTTVHDLTSRLQRCAFESSTAGRHVPLLIATDQEGGARVRIKYGVTRIPDPMHIGATRSAALAQDAGKAIGSEMHVLGVNTVLAPVADINNNDVNDVIGKRAFGAHNQVVAQLAVAFMSGLQSSHVLSFGKHFPGHGDAQDDPHVKLPRVTYENSSRLTQWDESPFAYLVGNGVNGIMTAHLITPIDPHVPVTLSKPAIDQELKTNLTFQGIVITDDLADMAAVLDNEQNEKTRTRTDAALDALEAGHDMLMFAFVRPNGEADARVGTLGEDEFETIYRALIARYEAPENRPELQRKVIRILRQKTALVPLSRFSDLNAWTLPKDAVAAEMRGLREKNAAVALQIFRESVVLITEHGRLMNPTDTPRLFGVNQGPLSRDRILKDATAKILIVAPVVARNELAPEIRSHLSSWLPRDHVKMIPLVYGWGECRNIEAARRHWDQVRRTWDPSLPDASWSIDCYVGKLANGDREYLEPAIQRKAHEILDNASDMSLILFGVVTPEHVRILEEYLRATPDRDREIVVLLYAEPYLLPAEIYRRSNVSVVELSEFPNARYTADVLLGGTPIPKDSSYLPFSIPGLKIDSSKAIGGRGELKEVDLWRPQPPTPKSNGVERNDGAIPIPPPPIPTPRRNIGGLVAIVLLLGAVTGFVVVVLYARGWTIGWAGRPPEAMSVGPRDIEGRCWLHYDPAVDTCVVFVHGILSSPRAFLDGATGAFWPELVYTDERAGRPNVFLAQFSTSLDSASFDIPQAAEELRVQLDTVSPTGQRAPLTFHRIAFIAHSAGGLVVRDLLTRYPELFRGKSVGLVLVASPSRGSAWADRLRLLIELAGNRMAGQLERNNELIADLDRRFAEFVHKSDAERGFSLRGIDLFEARFVIPQRLFRLFVSTRTHVVSERGSASYFGAGKIVPNTDHFSVAKPDGADHASHRYLMEWWTNEFAPTASHPAAA